MKNKKRVKNLFIKELNNLSGGSEANNGKGKKTQSLREGGNYNPFVHKH